MKITIEFRDTREDGFPEESCFFFVDGEGLICGWPLIADPGDYDSDSFVTKKEAEQDPAEVVWEASERGGEFIGIFLWADRDSLASLVSKGKP